MNIQSSDKFYFARMRAADAIIKNGLLCEFNFGYRLGFFDDSDTPLMFLNEVISDLIEFNYHDGNKKVNELKRLPYKIETMKISIR